MHVCLVCDHLKIHIVPVLAITNIVQTIFKMLDIFIMINSLYAFQYHKYLLYASYVYHISYIGFAVNWTRYCTATTRWCSTHTKNASQRPTTNTYCTGDGFIHSIIQLHHVHNHCLLNTLKLFYVFLCIIFNIIQIHQHFYMLYHQLNFICILCFIFIYIISI